MTEIDQGIFNFDVRQSVRGRNIARLTIAPLLSIGLIVLGTSLVPDTTVLKPSFAAIESFNGWSFLGFICIGMGAYLLLKTSVFAFRARSTDGEWHFRLTDAELLWHVPQHAHGREEGFRTRLEDLKHIEFRTVQRDDKADELQYWVHFNARRPVQLQAYSGVGLPGLVAKIRAAGVSYKETFISV